MFVLFAISSISALREQDEYMVNDSMKIKAIVDYCSIRSKINFCSPNSFKYMLEVLEFQRENYFKQMQQSEKLKMEIRAANLKQRKLRKFLDKNPNYRIFAEYSIPRYFSS